MTGICVADFNTDTKELTNVQTHELNVIEFYELMQEIQYKHEEGEINSENTEIVYETFKITTNTGKLNDVDWSLEHIGLMKYTAWYCGLKTYQQMPSTAKNFSDNKRLKALGLWHRGGEGHALDACRHLVLHLVQQYHWRPEGLLE